MSDAHLTMQATSNTGQMCTWLNLSAGTLEDLLAAVLAHRGLPKVGARAIDPLIDGVCEVQGYFLWPSGPWALLDGAAGEVTRTPAEAAALP